MPLRQIVAPIILLLAASQTSARYELNTFETGTALKQNALVSDGALVVFSIEASGERHYQQFPLATGSDATASEIQPLSDSVIFVDEIETTNGRKVALGHRDEVRLLGSDQVLVRFKSIYNAPVYESIPWMNVFKDLNGDGLDDFLIPSFEGYQVAVQRADGSFTGAVSLAAAPMMDMSYNSHPWYQAKGLFHGDMTGDGRADLIFWQDGQFGVYRQLNDGQFSAQAVWLPSVVPLDFDSVDGMSLRFSNQDQSNQTVTVIHSLADYDGDGILDLMTMQVKSEGVLNKKTTFSLHQGELVSDGKQRYVQFQSSPAARIESSGIQYDMLARDLDGDGDLDLMTSSIELGVGKIVAALLTSAIKIDLSFYKMEDGTYPESPQTRRTMRATFSLSSGDYWLPAVQLLDENRDGHLELFIQESDEEFSTYAGEPDGLFADRGKTLTSPLPKDPDLIRQLDINGDAAPDLLMLVPPPLGETEGHQVVLLISAVPF